MIRTVPATREHLKGRFSGFENVTVKAISVMDGDDVLCVGGTYKVHDGYVAFMKMNKEMKKFPKYLFKEAKRVLTGKGLVYAICDTSIDGADRFLKHLGLEHIEGDIWRGHL